MGNTKEEVYKKAKVYIDRYFNEEHSETISKLDLIKSFQLFMATYIKIRF